MIGIFAQTREEVNTLLDNVEVVNRKVIENMSVYNVTYNGNSFYIILTGIGKANVAFALSYALTKLCIDKVIVTGNSASLLSDTNPIGTLAISSNSVEWDVNFINLGYPANVVPDNTVSQYPSDAALQRTALEASNGLGYTTANGLFASGDTFVASAAQATQINEATGAIFLDIDTAVIGQLSYQMNIPYISVKGISNYADENALVDYNTNKVSANNLANRVVMEMLDTLFTEGTNTLCEENETVTNNNNTVIACPCNYNNQYLNNYFGFFW